MSPIAIKLKPLLTALRNDLADSELVGEDLAGRLVTAMTRGGQKANAIILTRISALVGKLGVSGLEYFVERAPSGYAQEIIQSVIAHDSQVVEANRLASLRLYCTALSQVTDESELTACMVMLLNEYSEIPTWLGTFLIAWAANPYYDMDQTLEVVSAAVGTTIEYESDDDYTSFLIDVFNPLMDAYNLYLENLTTENTTVIAYRDATLY